VPPPSTNFNHATTPAHRLSSPELHYCKAVSKIVCHIRRKASKRFCAMCARQPLAGDHRVNDVQRLSPSHRPFKVSQSSSWLGGTSKQHLPCAGRRPGSGGQCFLNRTAVLCVSVLEQQGKVYRFRHAQPTSSPVSPSLPPAAAAPACLRTTIPTIFKRVSARAISRIIPQ
jgi:hypothetical protein